MNIWLARVAWILLPFTLGRAISDAIENWSDTTAFVAEVLAWAAWALGAFALFAPRPWGLTVLRVLGASALVIAITCAWSSDAVVVVLSITTTVIAAFLATSTPVASASANSVSYGDEQRFPLRVPFALLLAPVPLAAILAAAGFVVPILMIAAGDAVGVLLLVVGVPVAILAARSLHLLARRIVVLVPAGIVIVDPLTLSDPVLMPSERVTAVLRTKVLAVPAGAIDLRLGTAMGSVAIDLAPAVAFARRRGRADAEIIDADGVVVAVLDPDALVAAADARRQSRR